MSIAQPDPQDQYFTPQPSSPRRVGVLLWLWVILALLIGAVGGYWAAGRYGQETAATNFFHLQSRFELFTEQSNQELQNLQNQLDTLHGRLLVEESTRKSLESTLQSTQAELGRARDQLAFFDRLLPPGPNGSVSVRALDFEPRGPTLFYRVLLMRNAPGAEPFQGQMQFVASGMQNGKAIEVTLNPAGAPGAQDATADVSDAHDHSNGLTALDLRFEQFQRSEGLLDLPEDFDLESVTLNVLEGKTIRVSRKVSLRPAD